MRKLFLTLILVLFPVFCFAAPFLVCDPQVGVISYALEVNGVFTAGLAAETDGSIKYDLAGMSPGPYVFKAQAYGEGGWPSDWSNPFNVVKPGNPLNLRILVSGE